MATYNASAVSDSVIAFLKSITLQMLRALRDNPIAIAEGATGAPRIVGAGIKRLADYPVLTVAAADTYDALTLVDTVIGNTSTSSSSYVVAYTMTVSRATGSLRFKVSQSANDNGEGTTEGSEMRILKNAVEIADRTTPADNAERTQDISVVPGDVIEVQHRRAAGTGTVKVSGLNVTADDAYMPRPAYIKASDAALP